MTSEQRPRRWFSVDDAAAVLDDVLDDVAALVRIESPSEDHDAIRASADEVERLIRRRLGIAPERIEVDGVSHLRLRLGDEGADVVLLAHHDTVWPVGTLARIPYSVRDGVIRGPGCFDMIVGLVSAVHAIAALLARDPRLTTGITLLVTGDEEVGSPASRALIEGEARAARAVLVMEASADGGALKTGRKGASMYTIELNGRAAHAGLEPESGRNAAVAAGHVLLALDHLGRAGLGTTVTPTVVSAGTTRNTVPATATVHVDVRAASAEEQQRVDRSIRSLDPGVDGCGLTVRGGVNRPPLEEAMSAELFSAAVRSAAALGLAPLASASVGGASDGNFTAGMGIPTLDGLGAVGGGAHAEHEHVLVGFIPERLALLVALLEDLRAASPPPPT